jgi:hypothetical protein
MILDMITFLYLKDMALYFKNFYSKFFTFFRYLEQKDLIKFIKFEYFIKVKFKYYVTEPCYNESSKPSEPISASKLFKKISKQVHTNQKYNKKKGNVIMRFLHVLDSYVV